MNATIKLTAVNLHAWWTTVAAHAGRDQMMPLFANIALTAKDQVLYACATDRFTAAAAIPPDATVKLDGDGTFLLPVTAMQRILTVMAPGRGRHHQQRTVTLKVTDERLTVTDEDTEISVRPYRGDYPPLLQLVTPVEPSGEIVHVGLDPRFLARLAKVTQMTRDPLRMTIVADRKPIKFATADGSVLAAFMPARLFDEVDFGDWGTLLDPIEEALK